MFALLFACFLLLARSGHIYPQDVIISPINRDTLSDITLIFTPETSLLPNDFLRIIFPFHIKSIQAAFWDTYVDCSTSQPTKAASISESSLPDDTNTYFVQLYSDLASSSLSGLTGNVTYFLTISGIPDTSARSNINLPVQMFSVSNNLGDWIVYDSNSVFGLVTLANPYQSNMKVWLSIPPSQPSNIKTLESIYSVNIDMTPQVAIKNQARVDIELTNPAFSILSCSGMSLLSQNSPALRAIFSSLAPNIMRAIISDPIQALNGATYRIVCQVQNPTAPGLSAVIVKNKMGYIDMVTESGTSAISLEAAFIPASGSELRWDEAQHKVELGWGYEASSPSALPVFALFRDASNLESWYQSVKTTFKPRTDVTLTQRLQVVISTLDDSGFRLLKATVYHNLPDFSSDSKVSCDVFNQGFLTCKNVGPLKAQQYFVSFRFALLATTATTTVSDFGKVMLQTQEDSPMTLVPFSQTTLRAIEIETNPPLFTNSGKGVIAYAVTNQQPRDYVTTNEDIILNFRFKYFSNNTVPVTKDIINMGIEFYTSHMLAPSTSPTCTIQQLTNATDIDITNCAIENNQPSKYTKLSFRIASFLKDDPAAPPALLFKPQPNDGTISFDKVKFGADQTSSLTYVNEYVFDYYARWVQGFDKANPTIITAENSSPFFFNSLVYNPGTLAQLQVGTTFFVTGQTAGGIGNEANDFPTLIRLTGSLTSTEQSAQRIILFFNDLEPLNADNPCFGPQGIVCSYSNNGLDTTQIDLLTDYSGSRRIEITTDLTVEFNIYIPVKTYSSKNSIGFFLMTASTFDDQATAQGILKTGLVKRVNSVQYTTPVISGGVLPIDQPSKDTPKITIPSGVRAGDVISSNIKSITTAYSVGKSVNSGTSIGAAYGYCANYDFATESGFLFTTFYSTGAQNPRELCVKMQYTLSAAKQITCEVCPVHNEMSATSLSITDFKLPTMAGVDFFDLTYVVSSNNGALLKAAKDNQKNKLTAFSLSDHSIAFVPENLSKNSKNVLTVFNFTTVSPLPQAIRIVISPTSNSLLMRPVIQFECQVTTIQATSCMVSGDDKKIQIDIVAGEITWPSNTHSVQFMVDSTAGDISSDVTVNYKAQVLVNGIDNALEALHHDSTSKTYTVNQALAGVVNLTGVTYLFGSQGARTIVSIVFQVPDGTKIYSGQDLIFNLGALATANSDITPECVIRDGLTGSISNVFSSCDVSDLTAIKVGPKDSTTGNFTLELSYLRVPSTTTPGVIARLISVDGTTEITATKEFELPSLPGIQANVMAPSNAVINRLYSNPGDVAEISVTLRPSATITLSSKVYLYFPVYYPQKLGYKNIWCTINDLPLSCSVIRSRLLQLTSFTYQIAPGSSGIIRIYGVMTPIVPVPPGNIFIAIDNDDDMFSLTEYIEVKDQSSVAFTANPLAISNFFATSDRIRQQSDYSFSFMTDATGLTANQIISIDFPDRFGSYLQNQEGPKIFLSKTGDTVITEIQSISFGSRFKIILPLNLNPLTSYTLTIKSVENPDYESCKMDRPMLIIADRDQARANSRTVPSLWDGPSIDYKADPNKKNLSWKDADGAPLTAITLSVGTYSPEIRIAPPDNEFFNSDISFSTSAKDITLLPIILTAAGGSPYLSLRIGASINAVPRTFLVKFDKEESSVVDMYSELPKLQVTLTTQKVTLPTVPLRIMRGGTSLPYQWELDKLNMIPENLLTIDASIVDPGNSPLSIVGPSSVAMTSLSPTRGFTFFLANNAGAAPSFKLTLSGTDAPSYQLESDQVTVTIIEPITAPPKVTKLVIPDQFAPTREQITVNVDQMASVYWHVAYRDRLTTTECKAIQDRYNAGFQFDSLSDNQEQYGVFYIFNENQDYQYEIQNLYASQEYSIVLCFVNQLGSTTYQDGVFKTKDNGATLSLLNLRFNREINRNQLTAVVCLFSRELQLPDLNVVAMDGTTCGMASPLSNFESFDYANINLFVTGDKRSDLPSNTVSLLNNYVSSVTSQNKTPFLNEFNTALAGAGILAVFNSLSVNSGPIYNPPTIDSQAEGVSIQTTDRSMTLYGLQLSNGNGIFYAIADPGSTGAPNHAQIRVITNNNDVRVPGAAALFTGEPTTLTISDLEPDTEYTVYYYGTSEDRTQYAAATSIFSQKVKTQVAGWANWGSKVETNFTLLLVIIVFISCVM